MCNSTTASIGRRQIGQPRVFPVFNKSAEHFLHDATCPHGVSTLVRGASQHTTHSVPSNRSISSPRSSSSSSASGADGATGAVAGENGAFSISAAFCAARALIAACAPPGGGIPTWTKGRADDDDDRPFTTINPLGPPPTAAGPASTNLYAASIRRFRTLAAVRTQYIIGKKSVSEPPKNPKMNIPMKQPLSSSAAFSPHCESPIAVIPPMNIANMTAYKMTNRQTRTDAQVRSAKWGTCVDSSMAKQLRQTTRNPALYLTRSLAPKNPIFVAHKSHLAIRGKK